MTPATEATLLRELAGMRKELGESMAEGFRDTNEKIDAVSAAQASAALDQARRNDTFASRERMHELNNNLQIQEIRLVKQDALLSAVDAQTRSLSEWRDATEQRFGRVDTLLNSLTSICGRITSQQDQADNRAHEWRLSRAGWVFVGAITALSMLVNLYVALHG